MGETWKANESNLSSGKGLFGNQLLDYKAAGLIFKSILNGTLGVNAGNFAIWGLFSTNAQNNAFFQQRNCSDGSSVFGAGGEGSQQRVQWSDALHADRGNPKLGRHSAGIHRILCGS